MTVVIPYKRVLDKISVPRSDTAPERRVNWGLYYYAVAGLGKGAHGNIERRDYAVGGDEPFALRLPIMTALHPAAHRLPILFILVGIAVYELVRGILYRLCDMRSDGKFHVRNR